jgi:uncharacterized protein YlzI (FlbEa/FlbD family)
MRITQGGVYVMVQKFGLEGLLVTSAKMSCIPEKETALINGKEVKVFDRVNVFIKAEMVEFRRSVSLVHQE